MLVLIIAISSCTNNTKKQHQKVDLIAPDTVLAESPTTIYLKDVPLPSEIDLTNSAQEYYTALNGRFEETVFISPPKTNNKGFNGLFKSFTIEDGLPVDMIFTSYADSKGNIWFGTSGGGLSCYNGKQFTNFNASNGLAGNQIISILEDSKKNIWAGTYGSGLYKYNGKTFMCFNENNGLPNNYITAICEDSNGNLWLGTIEKGVIFYDGKTFKNYTIKEGLPSNFILSITEDYTKKIWIGTEKGIATFSNEKININSKLKFLSTSKIRCLYQDNENTMWIGTSGAGLIACKGDSTKTYSVNDGIPSNIIFTISKDKNSGLWLGTPLGASFLKDNKFTNYTTNEGLPENEIRSICSDLSGNVWLSTIGTGVACFYGTSFTNFNQAHGLSESIITAIESDSNKHIWLGTYGGGLIQSTDTAFIVYGKNQGVPHSVVHAVKRTKDHKIWIGTENGLSCFYNNKFTNYTTTQGLPYKIITSIEEDKFGNLWLGFQEGGLSYFDHSKFENYSTKEGLLSNKIKNLYVDTKNRIWISYSENLSCFDKNKFINYTSKQGLSNNKCRDIVEDKFGNVWISTYGGGINRFDGTSFLNLTTKNNLSSNSVFQLEIDSSGLLIVAGNEGIDIISGFKTPNHNTIPIENNYKNDKLKNLDFQLESFNSSTGFPFRDIMMSQRTVKNVNKNTTLIASGSSKTGLIQFNLNELNRNKNALQTVIHSIKINNRSLPWSTLSTSISNSDSSIITENTIQEGMLFGTFLKEVEVDSMKQLYQSIKFDSLSNFYYQPQNLILPYHYNDITIEFTAIEPAKPFAVNYQWMLDGQDDNWQPVSKETKVHYGNLREGAYTFKLKCQSPDGIWSEPISYRFKVQPPFYRTWWAYLFYSALAGSSFILIYRWRTRALLEEKKELEKIVKERTIQVVKQMEMVEEQKELIEKQKEEVEAQHELIEEKNKEITSSINYALRIQHSILPPEDRLKQIFSEYFIVYKPRDIVSGDFYWAEITDNNFFFSVADCTGHGIPGAFMSLLNISLMNEAVLSKGYTSPSEIFGFVRKILNIFSERQQNKDGMDAVLCVLDKSKKTLQFSCANNTLWLVRNNELIEYDSDNMPVGKYYVDAPFMVHTLQLQDGDTIYLTTDGYPDQFGGEKGKKFKSKALKELLVKISPLPLLEQQNILDKAFEDWKKGYDQVDDVCLMGIRI
ncbi:MAG: SpoIIE family protein phosphatase [Bacteroidetes bacterium]|nr:SpoIIE family protein phosphatase [Bacteroidota bacterium]